MAALVYIVTNTTNKTVSAGPLTIAPGASAKSYEKSAQVQAAVAAGLLTVSGPVLDPLVDAATNSGQVSSVNGQAGNVNLNVTDQVNAAAAAKTLALTNVTLDGTKVGLPLATNILAGQAGIWKNSTDSKVYLSYNDGGVIKKVELI